MFWPPILFRVGLSHCYIFCTWSIWWNATSFELNFSFLFCCVDMFKNPHRHRLRRRPWLIGPTGRGWYRTHIFPNNTTIVESLQCYLSATLLQSHHYNLSLSWYLNLMFGYNRSRNLKIMEERTEKMRREREGSNNVDRGRD